MSESLKQLFSAIRAKISQQILPELGEDKLEPVYAKLLCFIESHLNEREELTELLVEEIKSQRLPRISEQPRIPIQAIAYCMHVLRWQEILEAAQRENDEYYSLKMSTTMVPLLDSYSDDWDDRIFYSRFGQARGKN